MLLAIKKKGRKNPSSNFSRLNQDPCMPFKASQVNQAHGQAREPLTLPRPASRLAQHSRSWLALPLQEYWTSHSHGLLLVSVILSAIPSPIWLTLTYSKKLVATSSLVQSITELNIAPSITPGARSYLWLCLVCGFIMICSCARSHLRRRPSDTHFRIPVSILFAFMQILKIWLNNFPEMRKGFLQRGYLC